MATNAVEDDKPSQAMHSTTPSNDFTNTKDGGTPASPSDDTHNDNNKTNGTVTANRTPLDRSVGGGDLEADTKAKSTSTSTKSSIDVEPNKVDAT
eukprot:CAMPEP_0202708292 /NCGR_PEP_ID=MMETSP1385-20130828/20527_1 /ASSEMBLY_ACC=CAM_ASM_000861 /TAXON_ID=933848 /ORGANISM="Elphidium margaritaceum" /LENGTH=94 /DNA_ID=CAMNT_0049367231 /DNA_START=119 /DNA_END=400 /DNA_ORIENTATION=+